MPSLLKPDLQNMISIRTAKITSQQTTKQTRQGGTLQLRENQNPKLLPFILLKKISGLNNSV